MATGGVPAAEATSFSENQEEEGEEVRSKPVRRSSITKLLIQGIRGFGVKDEQKAVIEFGTPLTLITGQNGAGKTTIIECLKYITTGELPPNSKSGAFVHDPKLTSEKVSKARIKLKFKDISGMDIVCSRLLQSTQKPRKMEQRIVDSSLEKIQPNGEKLKLTTRCADIDREMRDLLGVSKAIFSNVIFCHQEDSAWPLSEPKTLKAKFDDIFASTRYTKALDNFRKIQLDLNGKIRIYKAELHHLSKQKEKVDEVKANLQEAQRKVENSRADLTRIKNELEPAEIRLQELTDQYEEVSRIEKEIASYASSRDQLMRTKSQLESRLENVFSGSKVELHRQRDQHHSVVERNNLDLEECERQLRRLVTSVDTMKGRLDDLHKEQGRLKTEEQYHKDRVADRDKKMVSAATQLALTGYGKGPFQQDRVDQFLEEFRQHREQAKRKADREKQECVAKERRVQSQLDDLLTNLAKIQESVAMKNKTIGENRAKVASISKEMTFIGSGAAALEGVEQELARAEKELSDYHQQTNVESMENELDKLTEEKQKQSGELARLQKELSQLSMHSSARGAVDELKKQRRGKEESYQLELESVEPDLLAVMGVMPSLEQNLTASLRDLARGKEREKQGSSDQYRRATAQLSRLQAQQEELQRQLQEKKARMEVLEQAVKEVCGEGAVDSYQEVEESLQQKIDSASENISTVKGSQSFFRKSLEKLHSNHKCPLCMRGFEDKTSLDSTIKTITTRLNDAIPRMIPRLNAELHQLQEQQKKLQQLKPKIDELTQIRLVELSQREKALEEKTKAISDIQRTIEAEKAKQAQLEKELENIRALQPKVSRVTQLKEQLKELDEKVSVEEGKLRGLKTSSQRSQHVVSRELAAAQRKIEELSQKMDAKRQEITDCQRTERHMEGEVHRLKEEQLQMKSRMQKRETLLSKRNDLTAQIETLDREVKVESNRVAPVQDKIRELRDEKEGLSRDRGAMEAESWSELENLKLTYDSIKKSSDSITRYLRDGRDRAMEECNVKVQSLSDDIKTKSVEKKGLEEKMSLLHKQLANAKNRERELEDNLQLLTQREEIEQKSRKVNELKSKLQRMGLEQYDEEFQHLQTVVGQLRKDHARAEGHKVGQEDQVRHLQRELQSDLYATTEEKHRNMLIDLKTTEVASKDLGKYYRALDRAITRFHAQKMKDINDIIKELWIKTYKGGDIDKIEVRSDEGAQSSAEGSDQIITRRMYSYKVVMIKGRTELDMRGRCSAGQKVLASLIIRLALAETFCLTSGLLTLDEPTTNLDKDNVEGLAQALTDIIRARSENQKNFQLIIITHDEAFVELLGHTGYTDCFYRVTKNIGETSRIRRFFF